MKNNISKKILENAPFGYSYNKIVLNQDRKPVDFILLEVNQKFEKITGLSKDSLINKKATEVFSEKSDLFDLINKYGEAVLNNQEKDFEKYFEPVDKYYRIRVYSPEELHFVTIFNDISREIGIAKYSQQLLDYDHDFIDYQSITDKILKLSGAKYAAFNRFEENGKDFKTIAISGVDKNIKKGLNILGFNPVGKKWDHDPNRAKLIKGKSTTHFESLMDLTGNVISKNIIKIIEKTFDLGQTALVKITRHGKMVGDFTIMLPKNKSLMNEKLIETYAQQVGLFIYKKQAEKKLKESEERYKIVTEKNQDGIYIFQDNRIVFANDIICNLIGCSKNELNQINIWKFIHPDDRERIKKIAQNRALGKNTTSSFQTRGVTIDGDILHLEFLVSAIQYNGKYADLGTIRDITKRKQLEKDLKKSEKKYRTLVENSRDAIIILQKRKFKYVNNAFGNMVNQDVNMLIGERYDKIFNSSAIDKFHSIKSDKDANRFETFLYREDKKISVEANATIIQYDGKEAIFAAIRDITRQKIILNRLKQVADQAQGLDELIPICAGCNKIKDKDKQDAPWVSPAEYINKRLPEVDFTHGMCPECIEKWYPNFTKDDED